MTDTCPVNEIIHGDCLRELARWPEACVDLVFADPPYNLQLQSDLWRPNLTQVDAVNAAWDQFDSFDAYDEFTAAWLGAVRRVMKPTATIWVSGTYHNIFRVGTILQDLGFWLLNTITWFKPNAMPNFRGTRLKNDVEFIIWAKYDADSRYTFNHHAMKHYNAGKQLGSLWAWKIAVCGGSERLRDADGHKLHPTQKPEDLLTRILLASSQPGDRVLDPFAGTGTTPTVARRLRREWVGIERDEVYVETARMRVTATQPVPPDHKLIKLTQRQRPRRVPFKELLARGYLHPGQRLYTKRTEHSVVILPNGQVQAEDVTGSIHRVGAQIKGVPSCNGWTLWHYRDEETGQLFVIDELRDKVRQAMRDQEG